jgi:hypothetical protein
MHSQRFSKFSFDQLAIVPDFLVVGHKAGKQEELLK